MLNVYLTAWDSSLEYFDLTGRLLAILLSSATQLVEIIPAQAERDSGMGLKLFGFIAESVFAFIPEPRSESSRNAVRNHPESRSR